MVSLLRFYGAYYTIFAAVFVEKPLQPRLSTVALAKADSFRALPVSSQQEKYRQSERYPHNNATIRAAVEDKSVPRAARNENTKKRPDGRTVRDARFRAHGAHESSIRFKHQESRKRRLDAISKRVCELREILLLAQASRLKLWLQSLKHRKFFHAFDPLQSRVRRIP